MVSTPSEVSFSTASVICLMPAPSWKFPFLPSPCAASAASELRKCCSKKPARAARKEPNRWRSRRDQLDYHRWLLGHFVRFLRDRSRPALPRPGAPTSPGEITEPVRDPPRSPGQRTGTIARDHPARNQLRRHRGAAALYPTARVVVRHGGLSGGASSRRASLPVSSRGPAEVALPPISLSSAGRFCRI